ncbi:MAC/perforin domain-containing protein [uncultured Kordia sp.]|uniref:MAC/perforin domain-containing protein n=1 Tax=uncultured Kordia sp. TaxID=507699 RepID=UPI002625E187|nr:MAC/perforin domain-containing protein [uncultured Kordia sp.]
MAELQTFKIPYQREHLNGEGINLLTGQPKGRFAIEVDTFELLKRMSPGELQQLHELVESESEYKSVQEASLDIKASKYSMKVSAGFKLMLNQSITERIVIATSIGDMPSGEEIFDATKLKLSTEALNLLQTNIDRFVETYGTHFIGGYIMGATFDSYIAFKFDSSTDILKIKSKLKAGFNKAKKSVSGKASHSLELEEVYNKTEIRGQFTATGITGTMNISSIEEVSEKFGEFSENAETSETRILTICYPYTLLEEVQAVLNDKAKPLISTFDYGLIENICLEYRDLERARTKISSYNHIADTKGKYLKKVNRKYIEKLVDEIGKIKEITPKELANPSSDLLEAIGENSRASVLIDEWETAFKNEYQNII